MLSLVYARLWLIRRDKVQIAPLKKAQSTRRESDKDLPPEVSRKVVEYMVDRSKMFGDVHVGFDGKRNLYAPSKLAEGDEKPFDVQHVRRRLSCETVLLRCDSGSFKSLMMMRLKLTVIRMEDQTAMPMDTRTVAMVTPMAPMAIARSLEAKASLSEYVSSSRYSTQLDACF